jgi:hypothetical protein
MKKLTILSSITGLLLIMSSAFKTELMKDEIKGAFQFKTGAEEQVVIFADGYFTHTVYDQQNRKFIRTRGGIFTLRDEELSVRYEFDTKDTEQVGQTVKYKLDADEKEIELDLNGQKQEWSKIDEGNEGLAGLWTISARQQNGELVPIHQRGTRKTIKILSSTRFQWAAIDPGTKQFMGTGGGSYKFENGQYIENIEFFSRDSSRVGQSLSFNGKIDNGEWHHSGFSSKGDPIYEVWSRKK